MNEDLVYTIGYIDYTYNDIFSSDTVYSSFNDAIEHINYKIVDKLTSVFDIHPQTKYIFSSNNNEKSFEQKLRINESKFLLVVKKDHIIDIYCSQLNKGYVYNNEIIRHYFKFYINTHSAPTHIVSDNQPSVYFNDDEIFSLTPFKEVPFYMNKEFMTELTDRIKNLKVD